jgi:hypothetical protein
MIGLATQFRMATTLLYRCPATRQKVQAWFAEDGSENGEHYETVTCTACSLVHLVNPKTGKMLGADEEYPPQTIRHDTTWSRACRSNDFGCPDWAEPTSK